MPKSARDKREKSEDSLMRSSTASLPSASRAASSSMQKSVKDTGEEKRADSTTARKPPTARPYNFSKGLHNLKGVEGFCLDCDGCSNDCDHRSHSRILFRDLSVHKRIYGKHFRLQPVSFKIQCLGRRDISSLATLRVCVL